MKKILIILAIFGLFLIVMAELNYEQAIDKALDVETDMEIIKIMESHGYVLEDTFQDITAFDKINALLRLISDEKGD